MPGSGVAQGLQRGHGIGRLAIEDPGAQLFGGGIGQRSQHGDRGRIVPLQGQDLAFVLQQHHALPGQFPAHVEAAHAATRLG